MSYIETYILFCSTLDMSPQNNLMDASIETSPNCALQHSQSNVITSTKEKTTYSLNYNENITNTISKDEEISIKTKIVPTNYTAFSLFESNITGTVNSKEKLRNTDICCDIPKTWETTQESQKIGFIEYYEDVTFLNDVINTTIKSPTLISVTKQNTDQNYSVHDKITSFLLNVTDEKVNDKFISLQLTYFNSTTTPETKSDSASPTLLTKKLTLKSTEIINNTKYCCNRPKIWGKTTKMGAFNKNKSIEDSDTEYKNEVKDEKARLLLKENYTQTNDTANYTSNQFNFISPTAKKVVITQETVVSNIKMSSNRVLAKRPKKNLLTPSMFCNYHKCQIPLKWITTSKSKKRKLV